ncbi:hypothetical protein GF420_02435 [candidate division GN15 bacterium]|nr:hypothetical protein [candidate division GN15 bacterium]
MSRSRLIYQDWIVALGRDPAGAADSGTTAHTDQSGSQIQQAVREALSRLPDQERELIERFHFMGQTYRELAALSGSTEYKLEATHKRAVRKLRRTLAPFVRRRFTLKSEPAPDCPLCRSPERAAIDRLLSDHDPRQTWRPVLHTLRREFGIHIQAPQTIIGHKKYH